MQSFITAFERDCWCLQRDAWEMKMRNRTWIMNACLALILLSGVAVPASAQNSTDYAILIVGDEGSAEMTREEQVLINEMAKHIRQQQPDERLPIYSYHFGKERERAYCENKLNILSEDLLFVGIVELKNKVPLKVVYRIDRINNSARAAKDILQRAEEMEADQNGGTVEIIPPGNDEPAPQESKEPPTEQSKSTPKAPNTASGSNGGTTAASAETFRVQLGSFAQLKYAQDKVASVKRAQLQATIVETPGADGDTLYKVVTPVINGRTAADDMLKKFHSAGFEEAFLARHKN